MPATLKLNPDGNLSLGNRNGEFRTLQPAAADYVTGGYGIYGQKLAVDGTVTVAQVNTGLYEVDAVLPVGGQGGYFPVWNPTTNKLQIFQSAAALGPATQVPANTDLSALAFQLLLIGY